jgi:hypothetical protein
MKKCNLPPAPLGNKRATKLKDAKVRQEAFQQYCEHLSKGYPKEAFFFDHPTHSVSWETMDRYIRENPGEFPPILMQKAKSARYKLWFTEGWALMRGKHKGSPVVWQTIMRNLFKDIGWDREQVNESSKTYVEQLARAIRNEPIAETDTGDQDIEQTD